MLWDVVENFAAPNSPRRSNIQSIISSVIYFNRLVAFGIYVNVKTNARNSVNLLRRGYEQRRQAGVTGAEPFVMHVFRL